MCQLYEATRNLDALLDSPKSKVLLEWNVATFEGCQESMIEKRGVGVVGAVGAAAAAAAVKQ